MPDIFVNLKRFDVARSLGGLCPIDDPIAWIEMIIEDTISSNLAAVPGLHLTYLLPEGLAAAAVRRVGAYPPENRPSLAVGCQGVHWDDVKTGGNFGAFTTFLPAKAAAGLGCDWAIIGHSEERRGLLQVIRAYDPAIQTDPAASSRAAAAVNTLMGEAVACALNARLNVLLCIGETAEERGGGEWSEQQPRIRAILEAQLIAGLKACDNWTPAHRVVVGYEPVWAIGPGKTPPGKEYIALVSAMVKDIVQAQYGFEVPVVYGGGLKEENAAMLAGIPTINGGLIALTRFTGEIGFNVPELKKIIETYTEAL